MKYMKRKNPQTPRHLKKGRVVRLVKKSMPNRAMQKAQEKNTKTRNCDMNINYTQWACKKTPKGWMPKHGPRLYQHYVRK